MSAIAEKNLGNGRKFARIFKVYNRMIYRHLKKKQPKTHLFRPSLTTLTPATRTNLNRFLIFRSNHLTTYQSKNYRHSPPNNDAICNKQFCVLQHLALRFARDSFAFSRRQQCVLLLNATRFGAKRRNFSTLWSVFIYCCEPKMGVIFFKEKCKTIVNSKKWRKNLALMCSIFVLFCTFYIGFGRIIALEWGDKRDAICKVCLPN